MTVIFLLQHTLRDIRKSFLTLRDFRNNKIRQCVLPGKDFALGRGRGVAGGRGRGRGVVATRHVVPRAELATTSA